MNWLTLGIVLLLVSPSPALAQWYCWYYPQMCPATSTPTSVPTRTPTLTPTLTPTPQLCVQPESFTALCAQATRISAIPDVMTALGEVLACLNTHDPDGYVWSDAVSADTRIAYAPTAECPQWSNKPQCCTKIWNNYCGFTCDGIYTCDKGAGPVPCRVAGLTTGEQCPWPGLLIVLPQFCTDSSGAIAAYSALKYELINALLVELGLPGHDRQPWWGYEQCS